MDKPNKTFQIVQALRYGKSDLYERYINGDIVLQDIANEFNVSVQHVSNVILQNGIGNPKKDKRIFKDEEKAKIESDINNGLPIDEMKNIYKTFERINSTMSLFNSLSQKVRRGDLNTEIPFLTEKKLHRAITDINIMKYVRVNKKKKQPETLKDISFKFNEHYTVVANISSFCNKTDSNLLPKKNPDLLKIIIRNLDIVNYVTKSELTHEQAITEAEEKFDVDKRVIEKILACELYVKGADIDVFLKEGIK